MGKIHNYLNFASQYRGGPGFKSRQGQQFFSESTYTLGGPPSCKAPRQPTTYAINKKLPTEGLYHEEM